MLLTLEASMSLFSTSVLVPAGRAVTMDATKGKAKRTDLKKSILIQKRSAGEVLLLESLGGCV